MYMRVPHIRSFVRVPTQISLFSQHLVSLVYVAVERVCV